MWIYDTDGRLSQLMSFIVALVLASAALGVALIAIHYAPEDERTKTVNALRKEATEACHEMRLQPAFLGRLCVDPLTSQVYLPERKR